MLASRFSWLFIFFVFFVIIFFVIVYIFLLFFCFQRIATNTNWVYSSHPKVQLEFHFIFCVSSLLVFWQRKKKGRCYFFAAITQPMSQFCFAKWRVLSENKWAGHFRRKFYVENLSVKNVNVESFNVENFTSKISASKMLALKILTLKISTLKISAFKISTSKISTLKMFYQTSNISKRF